MRKPGKLRTSGRLLLAAGVALACLRCTSAPAPVKSSEKAQPQAGPPVQSAQPGPIATPQPTPGGGGNSAASAASEAETANLSTAIDRVLQELPTGNIAFNAPDSMVLGQTYGIHLLLSPRQSVQELQAELQRRVAGQNVLEGAQISIAPDMEARLSGQDFTIGAVTPERQAVSAEQETDWQWDVTPKEAGAQELHLTLNVILTVGKSSLPRSLRTFDRRIMVQVTWGQRLSGFVTSNWQWLWTVLVVPLAAWAWQTLKKRGRKRTPHARHS